MSNKVVTERTIESTEIFRGRLLRVEVVKVELEPGKTGRREIVHHPGAVAVLARLPDRRLVLVRQYRKPIERDLLEVVAGCLDPGEDPDACAAREVREETGYAVASLRRLGAIYPVPGYSDERLHAYYAELQVTAGAPEPDEDERVAVEYLTEADLEGRIARGEIEDAKTLAIWLLYRSRAS